MAGVWHRWNNHIDSFEGTHDEIHAGAGDDIIFSRAGSDSIYVAAQGVKVIVDYGSQGQIVDLDGITFEGVSINNLIGTRVGNDAYITYSNSGVSPVNDDNATIIAGYYSNPGDSTIEFLFADGGYVMAHQLLEYPDGVEPYGWRSASIEPNDKLKAGSDFEAGNPDGISPVLADGSSFALADHTSFIKPGAATDVLRAAFNQAVGNHVADAGSDVSIAYDMALHAQFSDNLTMAQSFIA